MFKNKLQYSLNDSSDWYLQYAFLMHSHKVQGLVDEVVAQRLEQALHQRHAEAVHSRPAGGVLGLSGETLLKDKEIRYYLVR